MAISNTIVQIKVVMTIQEVEEVDAMMMEVREDKMGQIRPLRGAEST